MLTNPGPVRAPWLTRALRLLIAAGCLNAGVAAAQSATDSAAATDTTRVVAGPHYDSGWLHRIFFGRHYRDLWATPIQAPVLDMSQFAGGLKVTQRGGGQQTKSIRLKGADGKEYQFRSLDKDPAGALPPALRSTAAADIVRDQTSAGHPVGALLAPPILQAAGVLHAPPRLYMLPRSEPRLGEFAKEFGGMLGTIEERPGDDEGGEFEGASEVISTTKLLKEVEDSPNDRVDARAFLTARLVDILIGDWDRHADQWRWARFGDDKPHLWRPIPRDRDQAFVRYDGLLLNVARASTPQLVNFGGDYAGMLGQTWNGRDLDRNFLVPLDRPVFDSVAAELKSKLTDAVLESAAAQLPEGYRTLDSARLVKALKHRRDRLPDAARDYYRHLAGEVDLQGTDRDELAEVRRVDGRFTEVSLAVAEGGETGEPYFRRRFDHNDTKEIRLHLHNGADKVRVTGEAGGGIRVRILPGKGSDQVVDSSRGGRVKMYSEEPGDVVLPGRKVGLDRQPYAPRDTASRDWGDRWLSVTWLAAGPDIGIFAGTGVSFTRYGFRRDPFAERYRLRAGWSTGANTGRADFNATWIPQNSRVRAHLLARASGIEVLRFHGFGNEVSADEDADFFKVDQVDFTVVPSLSLPVGKNAALTFGPRFRFSDTDFEDDRFITPGTYGAGTFGLFGGTGELRLDTRDQPLGTTRSLSLAVGGGFYPAVMDVEESFGEAHAEVSGSIASPTLPLEPTLALHVGGKKVWGDLIPFQEAAYIGDASTVRLGRQNRYAGNASLYAQSELRLFLTKFYFLAPADFGILGLADVGRVFLDGEESDTWHAAGGGGIWASFLDRSYMVSLSLAKSAERTALYFRIGAGL